eukprot:5987182-Amphidinium_carterae.1
MQQQVAQGRPHLEMSQTAILNNRVPSPGMLEFHHSNTYTHKKQNLTQFLTQRTWDNFAEKRTEKYQHYQNGF